MQEKRTIALLVIIMVVVLSIVGAVSLTMLYRAAIHEQKERLSEIARSMALHFEEIAQAEGILADARLEKIPDATLHRLLDRHTHYLTRTKSGEVVVARREENTMVFLLSRKWHDEDAPATLPFDSLNAQPMHRALSGLSGTMVGPDYRGVTVLAAYEPVSGLGLGVVTKIDLAEIKAPFIRAGTVAGIVALCLAVAASIAFFRISAPMIRRLAESEERYRDILDNITDIIYIFDDRGNIKFVNDAAARKLEYSSDELQTLNTKTLLTSDSYQNVARIYMSQIQGEDVGPFEIDLYDKQGRVHTIESKERLIWDGDRIIEVHGIGRDVTEKKKAEAAFQASELKYRSMILNLSEGFYSATLDGILIDHNIEFNRILGFDPETNLVGKRLPDFWQNPEDRKDYLERLKRDGIIRNYLIAAKKQNGDNIFVEASARIFEDEQGSPTRIEGSFIDVTDRKRAEDALWVLSSRQEAILDAVTDIIMEVDKDKVYTWANQAGYEFFGDDVVGKEASAYFEGQQDTYGTVQPLFNGSEDIFYVESWQRRKDGQRRLLGWWCRALKDEHGNVTGALSSARDITDRRAAEDELIKSLTFLDSMIDQSPIPMWISDENGTLMRINDACCDLLHITPREVIGKYNVLNDSIVKEQGHLGQVEAVFEKGETARFELNYDTTRVEGLALTGAASVYLDVTIFPVRDAAGKITSAVIQHKDITERKVVEKKILIQNRISNIFLTVGDQQMYDDVLNVVLEVLASEYGVFGYIDENGALVVPTMTRQVWDQCKVPEKNIVFPRETWGHSSWPRAIREKKPNYSNSPTKDVPAGHVAIVRHRTQPILFHGEVIGLFQVANKRSDYTEEDFLTLQSIAEQVAPILDARLQHERAETGIGKLNEDLEQRVIDRTAQLEAANKELESFSYSVSHDLRAPLRAMDGFTRVLMEDYEKVFDDEGRRLTRVIRDNTQRMGKLIDDLLAFSRAGRSELEIVQVKMELLAQSVLFELTTEADRARIDFSVGSLPQADGDTTMLRQVWTNLVSNAVKFSSKKERAVIEITGQEHNAEIIYSIRDNGAGFDMKYSSKLFGVFQRLHGEREFPGTGVGLAIVQRVIARHGGRVWAEGEVDGGAVFYFSLPKHRGES